MYHIINIVVYMKKLFDIIFFTFFLTSRVEPIRYAKISQDGFSVRDKPWVLLLAVFRVWICFLVEETTQPTSFL